MLEIQSCNTLSSHSFFFTSGNLIWWMMRRSYSDNSNLLVESLQASIPYMIDGEVLAVAGSVGKAERKTSGLGTHTF